MREDRSSSDVVVVGAGQAGLAVSRCLQREGVDHVVLERSEVGASWRTRWDSFYLNTPNQISVLPDARTPGGHDGFLAREADEPCAALEEMCDTRRVDLTQNGIRSVIWATGFGGDFSYLPAEWIGDKGLPKDIGGECAPGVHCVGLAWSRRRISGLIAGVAGDAEVVVERITQALAT